MPQRIEYLDIAKGLGIFCIVIGHNVVPQWFHDWIYSFHVPLFFIVSGYFYRQRSLAETLGKIWKQLLLPMLVTIFVAQVALAILFLRHGIWQGPTLEQWISDILLMRQIGTGMWFLLALGWGKLFLCLLHKMGDTILPIAVIVLFLLSFYLRSEVYMVPWSLLRGLSVPFYLYIGMLLNKYSVLEKISTLPFFLFALCIISIAWLFPFNMQAMIYHFGLLSVLMACVISLSVLVIVKKLSEWSDLPKRLFHFAGLNSLFILCIHCLIHTWQLDRLLWNALPPVGENVHFVLGLGVIALAECLILVGLVRLLNRVPWIYVLFHGRIKME